MPQDPPSLDDQLRELQRRYPLPNAGRLVEVFSDRAEICGLDLAMVGLVAQLDDGPAVPGSAAQRGALPVERAYCELLERFSLLQAKTATRESLAGGEFACRDENGVNAGTIDRGLVFPADHSPEVRRWPLSKGAALHTACQAACVSAHAELVERDAAMRSWWGGTVPRRVSHGSQLGDLETTYEVVTAELQAGAPSDAPEEAPALSVVVCVAFPKITGAPLLRGLSAKPDVLAATQGAIAEALQSLCFLWGEDLPSEVPDVSPTPAYHQDYYLLPEHHARLRAWLDGQLPRAVSQPPAFVANSVRYVDLTPTELRGQLALCKAISPSAVQLAFGPQLELCGEPLPLELQVHPIP